MEQGRELYLAPYKYGHGCILIHNTAFVSLHAACRYALRMKISEVRYVHTFRELVQLHFDSCARGHFYCLFGIFFFFVAMSCLYGIEILQSYLYGAKYRPYSITQSWHCSSSNWLRTALLRLSPLLPILVASPIKEPSAPNIDRIDKTPSRCKKYSLFRHLFSRSFSFMIFSFRCPDNSSSGSLAQREPNLSRWRILAFYQLVHCSPRSCWDRCSETQRLLGMPCPIDLCPCHLWLIVWSAECPGQETGPKCYSEGSAFIAQFSRSPHVVDIRYSPLSWMRDHRCASAVTTDRSTRRSNDRFKPSHLPSRIPEACPTRGWYSCRTRVTVQLSVCTATTRRSSPECRKDGTVRDIFRYYAIYGIGRF